MGMPIEEIIKSFDYIKHVGNGESTYEHCREEIALDEAVAIMRKYQKIEQIVNSNPDYIHHTDMDTYKLNSIREVIEDGKTD